MKREDACEECGCISDPQFVPTFEGEDDEQS
jgi:hypothetical protein